MCERSGEKVRSKYASSIGGPTRDVPPVEISFIQRLCLPFSIRSYAAYSPSGEMAADRMSTSGVSRIILIDDEAFEFPELAVLVVSTDRKTSAAAMSSKSPTIVPAPIKTRVLRRRDTTESALDSAVICCARFDG